MSNTDPLTFALILTWLTTITIIILIIFFGKRPRPRDDNALLETIRTLTGELENTAAQGTITRQQIRHMEAGRLSQARALADLAHGVELLSKQLQDAGLTPGWHPPQNLTLWLNNGGPRKSTVLTPRFQISALLNEYFNRDELNQLIFELGHDMDNFSHTAKPGMIRRLILAAEQQNKLTQLIDHARATRPNLPWPITKDT